MSTDAVREYAAEARSTDVFGRVTVSARHHHLIIDGPAENGCPGEALTPGEAFLGGIAACGVELIQVIARHREIPLEGVEAKIAGRFDPEHPVRDDVTVFESVRMDLTLYGVGDEDAAGLVKSFKRR